MADSHSTSEALDLTAAETYEHATDECDLIMKGGITSGIVYPRAACHLAAKYRFRHLGGASAGAIAATFVAAAEYGALCRRVRKDQRFARRVGCESRHALPAFASYSARIRTADRVDRTGWSRRRSCGVRSGESCGTHRWCSSRRWLLALLPGFAVAATSAGWAGHAMLWATLVWLPGSLLIALLAAIAWLAIRTLRALPANGYGLCDGHTQTVAGRPPLTDWMTRSSTTWPVFTRRGAAHLRGLVGLGWCRCVHRADGAERRRTSAVDPDERRVRGREKRAIDLQVVTTNLTFRRPYQFPFSTDIFFFCCGAATRLFPAAVVDHMVAKSAEVPDQIDTQAPGDRRSRRRCPCHGEPVRYMPAAPDIPLVVAARLSLSFPGLISAVPLFCIDWSRGPGHRELIEVWFSDGGISSNFPMHLFDALWPKRPTFGINLEPTHPDYPNQLVWRPKNAVGGIVPRSHPMGSMIGLPAIDPRHDAELARLHRDHDARLSGSCHRASSHADEGGMNLKMLPETIELLANRGARRGGRSSTTSTSIAPLDPLPRRGIGRR